MGESLTSSFESKADFLTHVETSHGYLSLQTREEYDRSVVAYCESDHIW